MRSFKIGDKVLRVAGVSGEIVDRTGVQRDGVYTVCGVSSSGGSIQLAESKNTSFYFDASAFSLVSPSLNWDINKAVRLRDLAVQAIQEYNLYLSQRPLLDPIDIPPIK